jgi:hypothetical protein
MKEYRKSPAINWSTLKYMNKSPLDYKMAVDYPSETTIYQKLGVFLHCALLEPEELEKRYVVAPPVKWGSNADKATTATAYIEKLNLDMELSELTKLKKEEFLAGLDELAAEEGKILIPETGGDSDVFNHEKAMAIVKANQNKQVFMKFLESIEKVEVETYATCEVTGLPLKGLIDAVTTNAIVDLKTIGTLGKMFHSLRAYQYLGQMAYYDYLARLNGIHKEKHFFMFIETTFPYKLKMIEIDPRIIEEQHNANIELLKRVRECQESGQYPDGSEQVEYYEYRGEESATAVTEQQWLEQSESGGQDQL